MFDASPDPPSDLMAIRYSLEYVAYSNNATKRQNITDFIAAQVVGRTVGATAVTLAAAKDIRGETCAFGEINQFLTQLDGSTILNALRTRAINQNIGNSQSGVLSYIRLTEADDVAMTILTRRCVSPAWADDPGTVRPL